ncbi:MAG: hypothetical protein H0V10_01340 [Geodermatophilaceae bacterium]|nr:hypothetical protein [Geodermatophilaceae bacterium]
MGLLLVAYLQRPDLMSRGIVPLTSRQRQLLSLVAGGYSSTQAARTLGISAQTGPSHNVGSRFHDDHDSLVGSNTAIPGTTDHGTS